MGRHMKTTLATSLLLSAFSNTYAAVIEKRLAIPPLPGLWVSKGCYTDVGTRTLSGAVFGGANNTIESCIGSCSQSGYAYAGTEYSNECYCSNAISTSATAVPDADCSMACGGNTAEPCGGANRINVFWSGKTVTGPSNQASVGPYNYVGCFSEGTNGRALSSAATASNSMTNEYCASYCSGYTYFGTEYGRECYCGNSLNVGSIMVPASDCSVLCVNSTTQFCGAGARLTVYALNGTAMPMPTSTISSPSSTSPAATGFPTGWTSQGCWVDGIQGRILTHQQPDSQKNSAENCVQTCAGLGYTIAGTEYGVQCFCDNFIFNGGMLATAQTDCNTPCPGALSENCGAGGRLSLYSVGTPQVNRPPGPQISGLPVGWTYSGCIQDNVVSAEAANVNILTLPYKVSDNNNNTPATCIAQCQKFGYNAAGLEYGSQCFCGDTENLLVASSPSVSTNPTAADHYTYSTPPATYPDTQCNAPCTGAAQYYCGSGNRLTMYTYTSAAPLYKWGMPTGADAGQYSLLIGGVIVPLITSQAVTGKITFLEKSGTGAANATGAYELDLTQINNFGAAWRQMNRPTTDVFCSGGVTLPDKAGRQLNVGGWAGSSNYGIRIYWPDGSAGVKGTNQWVEDGQHLQLQVPRWYPSAMMMANGSVLVMGGEVGQNAAEQPTLEILPPTGVPTAGTSSGYSNTTKYLDFLDRTAPFNLYPYMTVVPSGILVVYYNEARIIDDINFNTVKILPNLPGAVNDPTGGRSYQLQGAVVSLPQYAPFTDPLGVLACGGSTQNGGAAIDNCVSAYPEAENPTWTIERMPSRRVMPSMAGLPDGTYVILGGGQHGVAGFGLAGAPNYNAVLYDPSKPVNQRMSIMANTSVARMYHSEAITLLDGRVMISGSDPSGQFPSPADSFPEEYRIEVFTPPYLLKGLPRPSLVVENKDWAYGAAITFTTSATGAVRVSLLGSVSSTHGVAMGQRTMFPAVACVGGACTVTAPPNAHVCPPGWYMFFVLDGPTPSVGQFVRIGGDPAGLGNWPKLPGFNLPGI